MPLRLLGASQIQQACPMPAAIDAVARGFADLSAGVATVPLRSRLGLPNGVLALTMPAGSAGCPYYAVKLVTVVPANPGRGRPLIAALVVLTDAGTGETLALLDGEALTALRTGAAGGLAAGLLALPAADTVALFGAGPQARAQLLALAAVRPIEDVRLVSRSTDHATAFRRWAAGRPELSGLRIVAVAPPAALRGAVIVVTATSSPVPVFDGAALEPGVHVTAVGAFSRETRELDEATMQGARVFVDERGAALAEAGEVQGLRPEDLHEIGAVVTGLVPGRTSAIERTVFKSVGNAIQDLVVASAIYDRARELGLGEEVVFP